MGTRTIPSPVRRPSASTRNPLASTRSIPSSRAIRWASRSMPPLTIAVRAPRACSPWINSPAPGISGTRSRIASRSSMRMSGRCFHQMRTSDRTNSRSSISLAMNCRRPSAFCSPKCAWTAAHELATLTSVPSMSRATSLSTVAPRDRIGPIEEGIGGTDRPGGEVRVDVLGSAHADHRRGAHLLEPVQCDGRQGNVRLAGEGPQRPGLLEDPGQAVRFEQSVGELAHLGGDAPSVEVTTVEQTPGEGRVRLEQDLVGPAVFPDRVRLVAVEQVVPDLVHGQPRLRQTTGGRLELLDREVGDPDRTDLPLLPEGLEGAHRLRKRYVRVGRVHQVEVHRPASEAFQGVDEARTDLRRT